VPHALVDGAETAIVYKRRRIDLLKPADHARSMPIGYRFLFDISETIPS
jgi:hypothetical protein